ncbi:unnamed protein product [Gadus morhua 'NCC']
MADPLLLKMADPLLLKMADPLLLKMADPLLLKMADPLLLKMAAPLLLKTADPLLLKMAAPLEDNPSQEEKENRQHHALHHGNHQVDGPVESWRTTQGVHPWMERSLDAKSPGAVQLRRVFRVGLIVPGSRCLSGRWDLLVLLLLAGPLGADPAWHVEYPSLLRGGGLHRPHPLQLHPPAVHKGTDVDGEDVKVRSSVTDHVVKEGGQWAENLLCLGVWSCWEDEDGEVVKVRSSVTDNVVKEGGQVTLTCTSACSFHQLDVHWYRNGHALSETGPALHLSNLTNNNTGNYTCSLDSSRQKTSAPWSLVVLVDEGKHNVTVTGKEKFDWFLTVSVLLAVFLLLLAGLVFAKRRHGQKKASEVIQKQEGASEEVTYSTVHFKPSSSRSAPGPEHEIVYSEVVG